MLSLALPARSWAHRPPAGAKLAVLAVAMVAIFRIEAAWLLLLALAGTAALYASLGRVALAHGLGALRPVLVIAVVVLGLHALWGRTELGLLIALRVLCMVALANFFTMTTRLSDLVTLVERAAAPLARFGVNPRAIGLAMALFLRYVPVLAERGRTLREAWASRSRRRPGPRLVVPLVLAALDDSEHLADALRARGGLAAPGTPPAPPT